MVCLLARSACLWLSAVLFDFIGIVCLLVWSRLRGAAAGLNTVQS